MKILISKNIKTNREELKKTFNNSSDLILYEFDTLCNSKAMVAYIESLIDRNGLYDNLIKPLIQDLINPQDILSTVPIAGCKELDNMNKITPYMLIGNAALFIDGIEVGYIFELGKWDRRAITEPGSDRVAKGPKEGFVEDINVNKAMVRRKVKNTNLVFEDYIIGEVTNTDVSLAYINGIVNPQILDEVRSRIKKIKLDSVLDSGYIEQNIEDSPKSLIATIGYTEKPDIAAAKMIEGRILIICDGSPMVLTLPRIFIESLQTSEDYYMKHIYSTYLRIIRIIALIIAIVLPGFIVALKTFHHEMIPTKLLLSIAIGREGVPFTALMEGLLMILFFELIKESGLRIPGNIGSAVTVISGIVIGQVAVDAGLVAPIMVITVSLTGISEFIITDQRELVPIYRLIIVFLGGILGLFGIICGLVVMIVHLISLRSFGVPYMYPIAPYDKEGMKDFIIMRPLKKMNYRPRNIANKDKRKRNEDNE